MKLQLLIALLLLAAGIKATAQPSAGGIVYGPKGAFNLSAPKGWVLDPSAGAKQGMPCVLYPKDATWDTADPLMYAKIASTIYEDYEKFAAEAVADMKEKRPGFKLKRITSGRTKGGQPYFINEYPATKAYARHERVAYVQLPKAVAYIVYTADQESAFRKHQAVLHETVKSLLAMEADYLGKPKAAEEL
ncbi:MAG: hypothetical protein ACR2OZ_19860 [Verrucomicrobiales bacterium]